MCKEVDTNINNKRLRFLRKTSQMLIIMLNNLMCLLLDKISVLLILWNINRFMYNLIYFSDSLGLITICETRRETPLWWWLVRWACLKSSPSCCSQLSTHNPCTRMMMPCRKQTWLWITVYLLSLAKLMKTHIIN